MNAPIVRNALAVSLWLSVAFSPTMARAADPAAAPIPVQLGPGSTLWLKGTSTLHDFESRTTETVVVLARDAASPEPRNAADLAALIRSLAVRELEARIPVLTLK